MSEPQKENLVYGTVEEALPNALFRVVLDDSKQTNQENDGRKNPKNNSHTSHLASRSKIHKLRQCAHNQNDRKNEHQTVDERIRHQSQNQAQTETAYSHNRKTRSQPRELLSISIINNTYFTRISLGAEMEK